MSVRSQRGWSSPAVGLVTIGQAPRTDICADLRSIVGPTVCLLEAGALDPLAPDEIAALAPGAHDFPLITRLRTGETVQVAKARIVPLVQARIDDLARQGARLFVVLCTGEFPAFRAPGPVLLPQQVVARSAEALGVHRVGILPPLPGQAVEVRRRWAAAGFEPTVVPASPYGTPEAILEAAGVLRTADAELVILDCQGYRLEHRELLRPVLDCPILVPTGLVGRLVQELVA